MRLRYAYNTVMLAGWQKQISWPKIEMDFRFWHFFCASVRYFLLFLAFRSFDFDFLPFWQQVRRRIQYLCINELGRYLSCQFTFAAYSQTQLYNTFAVYFTVRFSLFACFVCSAENVVFAVYWCDTCQSSF